MKILAKPPPHQNQTTQDLNLENTVSSRKVNKAQNIYQLILEGKIIFDEKDYDDFQLEEPDPGRVEFKQQVELLRKRLLEDLPDFEDEIDR